MSYKVKIVGKKDPSIQSEENKKKIKDLVKDLLIQQQK